MRNDHIHQLCGGCAACPQCTPHESFCGRARAIHEIKARPNFQGMGQDEDPDAYDRMRDEALESDYGWQAIRREIYAVPR